MKYHWKILLTLSSSLLLSSVEGAFIPVGSGGYTTDLPPGKAVPSDRNNSPVLPKVVSGFSKPPKTNQWWSSLIWRFNPENAWSEFMFAHPLSFKAQAAGLEVGYPSEYFFTPYSTIPDGTKVQEFHYPHKRDLLLGIVGLNAPETKVADYSDWSVTAAWDSQGKSMRTTMGSGLPFVYVTLSGGDALISLTGVPNIWSNSNGVIGITLNGHHYGIFAPSGASWSQSGNDLRSNLLGKNYYSIAVLPNNKLETLEFFRKRAYAFVSNTTVSWNYNEANAQVTTTYNVETVLKEPGPNNSNINRPILALYRHQWLNSTDPLLGFSYNSANGEMKVVDASKFTTKLTFNGVLPFLPNFAKDGIDTYSANQLYSYIDTIYNLSPEARWQTGAWTDTYWMGKMLTKIAHLIPIADQVKHTAAKSRFLTEVETRLQDWLDGRGDQLFYYNDAWKTLIGYPASYGSDTGLNDHHFHYGYFVMAAAIVAQYDPDWAQKSRWGGMIDFLLKDPANQDRSDSKFPFLRNFDIYSGHGWASGAASFGSGNNEESSSEEINFHSGAILWGALTGNKALRDLGIYLYTTAASSIPQYWFDVNNVIFPPEFLPNTVAIHWSDGGSYATWFGGPAQFFHGINFLPINPGMLYLGKYPGYLKANQDFMLNQNNGAAHTDVWRDIHMSIEALYSPIMAINEFNQNANYQPESGETKAHTYHWIHNINQLGQVDTVITANTPTYGVFNKNGTRNYVAYNPNPAPIDVSFSDGIRFVVPSRSIVVNGTASPEDPAFTEEAVNQGEVTFKFKPTKSTSFVKLNYKINGGALITVSMELKDGVWQQTIHGLNSNDKIDHYYTFERNGTTSNSNSTEYVYKCGQSTKVAVETKI